MRLLEALAKGSGPQGVTELARQVDMDKSSVSRMLRTLEQSGLVARDESSRGYTLGLYLVHLGQKVLRRLDIRAVARTALDALADRTGECSHLAILSGGRALYIEQATPERGVAVEAPVGTLAPLHCTALGKALLAFQPAESIDALLSGTMFEVFTRRTLRDPAALRGHLAQVRELGVAFDDEEFSIGVRCIAAPVFRHDGSVGGAIGISGPSPRVTDDRLQAWTPLIRDQAGAVSLKLGWQADQAA
jgi:IclR family acetate operon transcriptional repressor